MKLRNFFHFIRTCYNFQADLFLIKMGLYRPNFSLVFLIHLFLYAGVYCTDQSQFYLLLENWLRELYTNNCMGT